MNVIKRLSLYCLFISTLGIAQKNTDPTPDEIDLAKKLRETHDKDDIALLESSEEISFDLNNDNSKVVVYRSVFEKLMNINYRANIQKYEFYDDESSIETFNIKYKNDKNTNLYINDEFYKDHDLFYNDARVKHVLVNFPVQGYSYNYELKKRYDDVKYFTALYFNDEYPTLKKQIRITVPDWLQVELKEFNFGNLVTKTVAKDSKNNTVYTYTMNDVSGLSKEEDIPGRSYIYPHLLVLAKSFTYKGKVTTLFNTSADLYQWYKSLVDLMKDDTSVLKNKVSELTANAKTEEEKIKNIYYWVQDNIRYIAFEDGLAGFKPDESNHVFENRYGDCKGMANLIKQMLKLAGFDARLTWIGTKHIAYDYNTPSLAVDNHMICTLFYKGKKLFLDGTEKYNSLGEYAERIQNKEVMIEDGNQFLIDKIPAGTCDSNKETLTTHFTIEKEKLKGTCNRSYLGESKSEFLYAINNSKNDKREENLNNFLANSDKNCHITDVKTSDLKNRDQKLTLDYAMELDNKVSSFDNEIYVDLEFLNEYKSLDFKDRKNDYEFDYKTRYEATTTLELPAGYKVSKMPENLMIKEPDFDISLTYQKTDKEIVYKKVFIFKNGVIKTSDLPKWNAFYKNLLSNYNQQITLTK